MTAALTASVGTLLTVGYAAAMPFGWAWFLNSLQLVFWVAADLVRNGHAMGRESG